MHLMSGTWRGLQKLRFAAVITAIAAGGLALPAAAGAQVTVAAYAVSSSLVPASSAGTTLAEPAIAPAPDGSDAEWFVVSGHNQDLLSVTPSGHQSLAARGLAADAGAPVNFASVSADGYDWVLDNDQGPGNVLYAVGASSSPSPGLNPVARFGDYGQDMTLGPDGALYISDNEGIFRCQITTLPSASCAREPIPQPFYTGAGAFAIGAGGNAVWFSDGSGELGAYGATGFSGPYPSSGGALASTDPGTIVTAANGYVYVAGPGASGTGGNDQILVFSPGDPQEVRVAASGLGNVVAMTVGPDGNVWFLDAGGGGSVAELDTTTGALSSYALPAGFWLPQSGWRIADGPSVPSPDGTGELFFNATTAPGGQGNAAIGVVSDIPFPVAPGALAFNTAVSVSKRHIAVLTFSCNGQANAACAGKLSLSVRAKVRLKGRVRASRDGSRTRYQTLTRVRHLMLGDISYDVRGGQSLRTRVKLSNTAYRLLEATDGHSWNATVRSAATMGTVTGTQLTMIGPTPPPKPKPRKPTRPEKNTKHRK